MSPRTRVPPTRWLPSWILAGLVLGTACSHTESSTTPSTAGDASFDPSPPVRLTFNSLADRGAAWLPDGSGILYSTQQEGRSDHDVCLALLPPDGRRQRRLDCDLSGYGVDSTNSIESPAPAADGRVALIEVGNVIGAATANTMTIAVAPTLDPRSSVKVQALPYTPPGEPTHFVATQLRWLDATRLVYLTGASTFVPLSPALTRDTVLSNLAAVLLDSGGGPPSVIPETDFASGVSPGQAQDEVVYTLGGDTRVFRRVLATGEVSVVHDFGAIARDVQVSGSRMTAVVGGRVAFVIDPSLGPTQYDSGGVVHVVDFGTGTDEAFDDSSRLFRRPALSPAGDRLVAEGYPVIITVIMAPSGNFPDTTVGRSGDPYLLGAP